MSVSAVPLNAWLIDQKQLYTLSGLHMSRSEHQLGLSFFKKSSPYELHNQSPSLRITKSKAESLLLISSSSSWPTTQHTA